MCIRLVMFFFFKQKTAYEVRISDWSSDVCSSDLGIGEGLRHQLGKQAPGGEVVVELEARQQAVERGGVDEGGAGGLHRRRLAQAGAAGLGRGRSEERRVGKECVRTGRSRWWRTH